MRWLNDPSMRLLLVGFVAAIVLGGNSLHAADTWIQRADMPTPRWLHTSAAVNGKIYVIGGVSSEPNGKSLSTVEEYDPATDTWTRKADMPTARGWIPPSGPVVDGKIYVIGGGDDVVWAFPTVEVYDPVTDTWTHKADMPTPRWCLATCSLDGKIYAIGGAPNIPESYVGLQVVEVYDPVTDTWTRKASMLSGKWGLCASVVDGKIYAIGGASSLAGTRTVQEYDPSTDKWTLKASIEANKRNFATSVWCGKIYTIGGWGASNSNPKSLMEVYDPSIDTWSTGTFLPEVRSCLSSSVVNGKIYAIGGTPAPHPCPATSTVYEYDTGFIPRSPDINGDGVVDSADLCIMVDHWGENYPLCDIAPEPCGDGIVDVLDLILLAEHLFKDYRVVAQWDLDETEGSIVHDSIVGYDGTCHGAPIWQPGGGKKGGALLFDGIDDYVSTPFILNPDKVFSAFTWIKGESPGQAIISQAAGQSFGSLWLGTDISTGALITGLMTFIDPLKSPTVVTDGQWHEVGLVWDGSRRQLYVDSVKVAEDATSVPFLTCDGGLYIGAGVDLETESYFSGLIDDIRIYNRPIEP